MNPEELQVAAFEAILNSENARTMVHEAFDAIHEDNCNLAEQELQKSSDELLRAHQAQTNLLQEYTGSKEIKIEVTVVHAQDHLMTTTTFRGVALEMLELYKKVS